MKVKIYKTYTFQRDPLMDEILGNLERRGYEINAIAEVSDVGRSTLRNWNPNSHKPTRRPLISSLRAVARAAGMDLVLANSGEMALFAKRVNKLSKVIQEKRAAKQHGTGKKKRAKG